MPYLRQYDTMETILNGIYRVCIVYSCLISLLYTIYFILDRKINFHNFIISNFVKLIFAIIGFYNHKYNHYPEKRQTEIPKYIVILQNIQVLNNKEYHDKHHINIETGQHFSFINGNLGSDQITEYLFNKFNNNKFRICIPIIGLVLLMIIDVFFCNYI